MPLQDGTGSIRRSCKQGRQGGLGAGRSIECKCSKCGNKEPHIRGVPCSRKECSKCGTPMRGTFCS